MRIDALEYRIAQALEDLDQRYKGIIGQLTTRVKSMEARLDALNAVMPPDIQTVARTCQALGLSLESLRQRQAKTVHATKVNLLFNQLRKQGWSADRIARATGYTSRGVVANLHRFSNGNS